MPEALAVTADGQVFRGRSIGADGITTGEVVFNTSMTGYQEIFTDPSYAGQVVLMTYPTIGNYGINEEDRESSSSIVRGFIVKEFCVEPVEPTCIPSTQARGPRLFLVACPRS